MTAPCSRSSTDAYDSTKDAVYELVAGSILRYDGRKRVLQAQAASPYDGQRLGNTADEVGISLARKLRMRTGHAIVVGLSLWTMCTSAFALEQRKSRYDTSHRAYSRYDPRYAETFNKGRAPASMMPVPRGLDGDPRPSGLVGARHSVFDGRYWEEAAKRGVDPGAPPAPSREIRVVIAPAPVHEARPVAPVVEKAPATPEGFFRRALAWMNRP